MKFNRHILLFPIFLLWAFFSIVQSHSVCDSLKQTSLQSLSPQEKLNSLFHIIDSLYTSNPELCLGYGECALELAVKNNDEKGKLGAMNKLAHIYWQKSDFKLALYYANQVKIESNKLGLKKEYADALIVISQTYSDLGDYDKSSEMSFEALKLFEELEDKKGISKALYRVGNIYFEQEKWQKSLEYNQQSLDISREINDIIGIARGLNNVAADYGNMGELDNFEDYIRKAIVINRKSGRKLWEGINYLNLAITNREKESYDTAFYYYNKAEALFVEINHVPKRCAINTQYSKYYEELEDLDKSLVFAKKAYQLGKENHLKKSIYVSAMRLHYVYQGLGNIDSAYKYSQIQYQLKDSLDLEKSMNRLLQLELLSEFEKQEQLREIERERIQFQYIITAIIVISFFVFIILILVARHRLKAKNGIIKRKELEGELESKNKELTSNVMGLMRKNEILSELATKLMKVRDDAVKDDTKMAIQRIASELEQSTNKKYGRNLKFDSNKYILDFTKPYFGNILN